MDVNVKEKYTKTKKDKKETSENKRNDKAAMRCAEQVDVVSCWRAMAVHLLFWRLSFACRHCGIHRFLHILSCLLICFFLLSYLSLQSSFFSLILSRFVCLYRLVSFNVFQNRVKFQIRNIVGLISLADIDFHLKGCLSRSKGHFLPCRCSFVRTV